MRYEMILECRFVFRTWERMGCVLNQKENSGAGI